MNPSESGIAEHEVLGLLAALVDKSLVAYDESTGRYRLLETVRRYGQDRLVEEGEAAEWQNCHLDHFLVLAEEAEPHLTDAEQQVRVERLESEHENLRSAMDWSNDDLERAGRGLRLATALWRFWYVRGHFSEGRGRLSRAIADGQGGDTAVLARALNGLGNLEYCQGDYSSAKNRYEQSLAYRRELDDRRGIAGTLNNLGNVAHMLGDSSEAQGLLEENLAIFREMGDRRGVTTSLNNLGIVARDLGDFAKARLLYEESAAIGLELGDRRAISNALNNLGVVALDQQDYVRARRLLNESLTIKRELGDLRGIAECMDRIAILVAALGSPRRSCCLWGASERLRNEIGAPRPPSSRVAFERQVADARVALGDTSTFDAAWNEGGRMTLERALEYALNEANEHA